MTRPLFTKCPICKGKISKTNICLREGNLLLCESCNHLLSGCNPSQYKKSLTSWDISEGTLPGKNAEHRLKKNIATKLNIAEKFLSPSKNKKLLDVGCSSGSVLKIASELGYKVKGVDTAIKPVITARKLGFDVFHGTLNEAKYKNNEFDLIILFEILEHIVDPVGLLKECHRILKKDGLLLINTPNPDSWSAKFLRYKWTGYSLAKMGGHISFFSPKSMEILSKITNLKLTYIKTKNVSFFYKENFSSKMIYKLLKLFTELFNLPAQIFNKGHDLFVILKK